MAEAGRAAAAETKHLIELGKIHRDQCLARGPVVDDPKDEFFIVESEAPAAVSQKVVPEKRPEPLPRTVPLSERGGLGDLVEEALRRIDQER